MCLPALRPQPHWTLRVVSGVPVTDSSWGYFLPLSTVWAFLTDGGWLEWLGPLEWQWLTAWWHGWQSEVRGGDRWATVSHWGGPGRGSGQWSISVIACSSGCLSSGRPGITQNCSPALATSRQTYCWNHCVWVSNRFKNTPCLSLFKLYHHISSMFWE